MKQWTFSIAGAVALLFGLWLLQSPGFRDLDLLVTRAAAHWRSPFVTSAFLFFTELGRVPVALIWSVFAFRRSSSMGLRVALACVVSWLASEGLKLIVYRPRPIEILPLVNATGYSFPSGHTCVAAATYGTLALLMCRATKNYTHRALIAATAVTVIVLVAASRVYLGVHYATDVVAGMILGVAIAMLISGPLGGLLCSSPHAIPPQNG